MMKSIIKEAEKKTNNKHKDFDIQSDDVTEVLKKAIAKHALLLADEVSARVVVVFSATGHLATYISSFKPNQSVISFTISDTNHFKFDTSYGVFSEKLEKREESSTDNQEKAIAILKEKKLLKKNDYVIVIGERLHGGVHQPQLRVVPVQ